MFYLRDFSKGPFFLWAIALLVLGARGTGGRAVLLAGAAGAVAGIGYGFRSDLALLVPLGLLFLTVASRQRLVPRAASLGAFLGGFLLLAAPVLVQGSGSNGGFLAAQGATEPFRAFALLRPAPYMLGQAYSDELTLSGIAATERLRDPGWDTRERSHRPAYDISGAITLSSRNLLEWAPLFPADFAAGALKGAAWILGYPALVAASRAHPDPGVPIRLDVPVVRWAEPAYALFDQAWLPLLGLLGVLAWLWRSAARSGREATGLTLLLAALVTYPAIQFSTRHLFHLEFVWVIGLLSIPVAIVEWRRLRPVAPHVLAGVVLVLGGAAGLYAGLAALQQRALTAEIGALLDQARTPSHRCGRTGRTGPSSGASRRRRRRAPFSTLRRIP
ncbi:hypothetical protein ACE7GA_08685 [Roseomonas sp. CCTCC AB2023176]|uniref:hypothetical protein n=1 Tax=Roseomonas sp. CCTCC AB2023176 TaxID=3342640 RepID=UPI0035D8FA43